jgi:hypothetical protein
MLISEGLVGVVQYWSHRIGFTVYSCGQWLHDEGGGEVTFLSPGQSVSVVYVDHRGCRGHTKVTNKDGIAYVGRGRPWERIPLRALGEDWNLFAVTRDLPATTIAMPAMVVEWDHHDAAGNNGRMVVVESFSGSPMGFLGSVSRFLGKALHQLKKEGLQLDGETRSRLRSEAIEFARRKRRVAEEAAWS